jgi:2-phosphoglycerate kinase
MVILIGGRSSVGKTTAAADLASRRGFQHVQVDALRAEELHPAVQFVGSSPEVWDLGPEALRDRLIEICEVLRPHILRIVSRQLALGVPAVVEGEGIEPSLLESLTDSRVRLVFVAEVNEKRLAETLDDRPSAGAARFRQLGAARRQCVCRMNRLYGEWIEAEALRRGLPCLPSQPWKDLADRIFASVAG